ncbi:uncharacterized protein P174DRAFT_257745 [Aspergillus novofumigatus IBT 16806]|uniref:Uncharacterized protein n=1 Tax=Aspergillus novofumigatus (strain IBT 16806) TaxID=1392255 RepID=A0A2I1C313_ASPN1|nr:uncharacterized protein P174DRAFT_257745 [Aspergillus novofumigatus IBT 16806]PKX92034.1 hypothetical protein P174DRAFT_257745 [Aspergillus novofumigatus IBT 16806]
MRALPFAFAGSLRLPTYVAHEPASLYIYLLSFWVSVIRRFEYSPAGLDVSMSFLCSFHSQFVEERLFCASCKKRRGKKHFSKKKRLKKMGGSEMRLMV